MSATGLYRFVGVPKEKARNVSFKSTQALDLRPPCGGFRCARNRLTNPGHEPGLIIGLVLIGFFIAATSECSTVLVQNGGLLNKVRIPFEAFPLATVSAHAFQLLAGSVPLLLVLSLVMNRDPLHVLLLTVPFAALIMLAAGMGLITSAAGVFFRDTPHLYELATFLLWVTTPVFYPAAIVPARLAHFLVINPLYAIVQTSRDLVLTANLPPWWMFGLALAEGALVLALGAALFRSMRARFMDHV